MGVKWQSSRTWNSPLSTNIPGEVPRSGSPNWRCWRANGIAPVSKPAGLRPRESQCFSCSLRAGQDWCPSLGSRAGASAHRQSPTVLFRPAVYWMGSLMLGRAICCTQSTDSCIIHSEKPSRHTQSNILKNVWALLAQASWHVKVDCHKNCFRNYLFQYNILRTFSHVIKQSSTTLFKLYHSLINHFTIIVQLNCIS